MEYYSAMKRYKLLAHQILKNLQIIKVRQKKLEAKEHILYDSTYISVLQETQLWKQSE